MEGKRSERETLEKKFKECLSIINECNKERQECDPDSDRKIQAYATLALAYAVKGLWDKEKKLEVGDIKDIFCAECKEKTEHILILRERGLIWKCTKCNRKTSLGIQE